MNQTLFERTFMDTLWEANDIESIARDSYYENENDEDLRITVEMIEIFESAKKQTALLLEGTNDYVSLVFKDKKNEYMIQIERKDRSVHPNGIEHVPFKIKGN